ncbi:MAG: efflux RND transporter periplasmic adaptor subunit [Rhodobacteraceae bacterium]|nr:efflux RND transporter periplasmic adaptor subunit [Paracoccaceae bacterium]
MRRGLVLILVILGLAAAGWWYAARRGAEDAAAEPPTVTVGRGTVERTVLASGVIEAGTLLPVGARVSGQIETLAVELGQKVAAGDLVAVIDSLDQQNEVLKARADLAQIEAQQASNAASIREAELALDRTRQLNRTDLASTQALESAEATLAMRNAEARALQAQRDRAEVALASAELALERTRITTPVGGTVVAIVTDEGETVNAASEAPTIVKIADLEHMVVKAAISEADVIRVRPGQTATLSLLGDPSTTFDATLRFVEPAPQGLATAGTTGGSEGTEAVYYNGLLDVDNPDGLLRIGMTVQVSILLDRVENVLTVPSLVITRGADGSASVRVWDPATRSAAEREVRVGLDNAVTAEIVSGLAEGEKVVATRDSTTESAAVSLRGRRSVFGF